MAGQIFQASNWNTYIRDNINATGLGVLASGAGYYVVGNGVNSVAERTAGTNSVNTSQTTTSTTYVDLATTGPTVTLTTGTKAIVVISSGVSNNTAGMGGRAAVAISGATTSAASDTNSFLCESGGALDAFQGSWFTLYNPINSGSNTFTMKYRLVGTGTVTFVNRALSIMPF